VVEANIEVAAKETVEVVVLDTEMELVAGDSIVSYACLFNLTNLICGFSQPGAVSR
jgi:hypothetical protein